MMVEALTLENYAQVLHRSLLHQHLRGRRCGWRSICTLVCLLLAFPLAYVLARTESRYKHVLLMLVVLPLFVGNAVRAAGWMTLFGSKGALQRPALVAWA